MKKIFAFILALSIISLLCACTAKQETDKETAGTVGTAEAISIPSVSARTPHPDDDSDVSTEDSESTSSPSAESTDAHPSSNVSLSDTPNPSDTSSPLYENEKLGFSLQFPANWYGRYIIREGTIGISVCDKAVVDTYGEGMGTLFSIVRITGELISQEDIAHFPVPSELLLQGNGYTYVKMSISDVQAPLGDEKLCTAYSELFAHNSDVYHSIALLGNRQPPAEHDGYKVVGTTFFTLEIPEAWNMRIREDALLTWDMYDDDAYMGKIMMTAMNEYVPDEKGTRQDALVQSDLLRHNAAISLQTADTAILAVMRSSLKLLGHYTTAADIKTNAERYIQAGGEKLFGKIDDVIIENHRPRAVTATIMEFDYGNNTFPDAFYSYEKTFSITEIPVQIAPLAVPYYKIFETYGFYFNSEFLEKHPNYKDCYYDFVTDGSGMLQVILGHYIP